MSFTWKWYLKDLAPPDKPVKVFSCFSCGGGSTMGYKRAGFDVLGNVEIDPKINAMYVKNHHPRFNFNMDIRDFNKLDDLPPELFSLDILDGSPPCTTFSTAGQREKTWGKKKRFAEGQALQTLDDLFFVFIETMKKLRPRVVIAENVMGLVKGNAKGYVNEIIKGFRGTGYDVQIFRLNAALMDVPQRRERIFFIANNQGFPKLTLNFNQPLIKFGEVRSEHGKPFKDENSIYKRLIEKSIAADESIADVRERLGKKPSGFNHVIIDDGNIYPAVCASSVDFRRCDCTYVSDEDIRNVSSFPQDYDFCGNSVQFVCGMSVPPNMTAHIAAQIWRQWLSM